MTPAGVCELLLRLAALPPMGEPVDQLAHAMQTAGQAIAAGADNALVVAAALHDIARLPEVAGECPRLPHEAAGARFCSAVLGARVAWLVGAHVLAKRVLVATEPAYAATLSVASTSSLTDQGGAATGSDLGRFTAHAWAADALSLRRWDDRAKVPGAPTPQPADLLDRLTRLWL
ncbi:MAG TPA: HD family phosphohydrolase [Candidatus Dormibacteraeota bacterium]